MDIDPVIEAWQRAVAAPQWSGPPRWLHGDFHPGNIVFADDLPRGVIDWGLVVGDPATDLMLAWNFDAKDRDLLRLHLNIDDDTWARGAGSAIYPISDSSHSAARIEHRARQRRLLTSRRVALALPATGGRPAVDAQAVPRDGPRATT